MLNAQRRAREVRASRLALAEASIDPLESMWLHLNVPAQSPGEAGARNSQRVAAMATAVPTLLEQAGLSSSRAARPLPTLPVLPSMARRRAAAATAMQCAWRRRQLMRRVRRRNRRRARRAARHGVKSLHKRRAAALLARALPGLFRRYSTRVELWRRRQAKEYLDFKRKKQGLSHGSKLQLVRLPTNFDSGVRRVAMAPSTPCHQSFTQWTRTAVPIVGQGTCTGASTRPAQAAEPLPPVPRPPSSSVPRRRLQLKRLFENCDCAAGANSRGDAIVQGDRVQARCNGGGAWNLGWVVEVHPCNAALGNSTPRDAHGRRQSKFFVAPRTMDEAADALIRDWKKGSICLFDVQFDDGVNMLGLRPAAVRKLPTEAARELDEKDQLQRQARTQRRKQKAKMEHCAICTDACRGRAQEQVVRERGHKAHNNNYYYPGTTQAQATNKKKL